MCPAASSLYLPRHKHGQHVWQDYQIRHEPVTSRACAFSLVKSNPAWLRPRELKFKTRQCFFLCKCWQNHQMNDVDGGICKFLTSPGQAAPSVWFPFNYKSLLLSVQSALFVMWKVIHCFLPVPFHLPPLHISEKKHLLIVVRYTKQFTGSCS